ncbi:MAG: tyrosine--tRNA ligase, partial [Pseudomonadota bacterium]
LPTADIEKSELDAGYLVAAAFSLAGLTKSNGDARRMIKQGAARVNDVPVSDQNATLKLADLNEDGAIKLSAGKKRHALIRLR